MRLRQLVPSIAAIGLVASFALPAGAAPVDDKKAEALRIQSQIEANGAKISAAAEAYNGAIYRAEQTQAQIEEAQLKIDQSRAESERLRLLVGQRAASIYKQAAGDGTTKSDTSDEAADDITAYSKERYSAAATAQDDKLISGYTESIEELDAQTAQLETVKAQAEAESEAAKKQQAAIESLNAKQQQLLKSVQSDIAQLIKEEEQRQQQAARAAADAAAQARRTSSGATATTAPARTAARSSAPVAYPEDLPAPSGYAAEAIAFARAQLGKPYRYAASGPDSYDCSGLTMAAYGAAGLRLPHYSGAQYAMFPKVPLDQLAPGDLVFRGPGGSQHVALYIGGGLVIDAPQTGDVVRVRAMGNVIGGVRPG